MTFGLVGFIALEGFKSSLDYTIKQKSKTILGADFGMSARRPLKKSELNLIKEQKTKEKIIESKTIELYSMIANKDRNTRLIQIKAIQENFPFYGKIHLKNQKNNRHEANYKIIKYNKVWVYPEVLQQLKVSIGDKLFIGKAEFIIDDVILDDAAAGISTNMAPRIYIGLNNLSETNLIRPGSIAWHSSLFKIENKNSIELENLREYVFKEIDNPDVRVFTHENASQQMARLVERLNDFLGLTSLVALFLAGLGSGFLFRSYLKGKTKEIAILICLGVNHSKTFMLYLTQVAILGFFSSLLAIIVSIALVPIIGTLTKALLPFPIEFSISPLTIFLGMIIGTLGSIFICLPILSDLNNIKPSLLLSNLKESNNKFSLKFLIAISPAVILFVALAIILSNSFKIGTMFAVIFIIASFTLSLISLFLFSRFSKFKFIKSTSLRWALRDLARNKFSTTAGFISIGLGVLLLNLIPQIQASLDQELKTPEKSKVPSFFMFDIQEEQLNSLKNITNDYNVPITQLSPMIRARLSAVNDIAFDKGSGASAKSISREEEDEMRFRNRGFNLSFRDGPSGSEKIIEGKGFSGTYSDTGKNLPEISVEKRFAGRLNLNIGDKLTFDIEGVPIAGRIINLRTVKWTSFQPNFFIQFQPGVLEIAPKTYIATIPKISNDIKQKVQNKIVELLPNISIIDVSRLVSRISTVMDQMSWALKIMSLLCIFAGLVVIFSIANHQANSRKWDIGLLKSLGANFNIIKNQYVYQFVIVGACAALSGAVISLIVSYLVSNILFDGLWAFDLYTPVVSVIICIILTVIITYIAIKQSLNVKTIELFSKN